MARRLFGALVASLFATAYLAIGAHQATTRHVECPEHGELVHAPFGGASESPDAVGAPAAGHAGSGDHEHCFLTLGAADPATSVGPPRLALPADVRPALAPVDLAPARRPLAVAPKTSPPSA